MLHIGAEIFPLEHVLDVLQHIVQHVNSVHRVSGAAGLVFIKSTPVSIRLSIKLTYSEQDILSFYLKCVLYVCRLFLYGYLTSYGDMMAAMLCC